MIFITRFAHNHWNKSKFSFVSYAPFSSRTFFGEYGRKFSEKINWKGNCDRKRNQYSNKQKKKKLISLK